MTSKISQSIVEELSYKNHQGTITPEEKLLLEEWYAAHDDTLFYHDDGSSLVKDRIWERIARSISYPRKVRFLPRLIAAACILVVSTAGLYYLIKSKAEEKINFIGKRKDFAAGGKRAILILSDGRHVDLATTKNIQEKGGAYIKQSSTGTLEYHRNISGGPGSNAYNTIETPAGGEYQVILPDGSLVWLNAESSLRYPVSFLGKEKRTVELNGEAYFEVHRDRNHPFVVSTKEQKVTVLGTHFNINSYEDEPETKTALLQGAIRINSGLAEKILSAGERSLNNGKDILVSRSNLSQDIAWKNGYFEFQDTDLRTVMRQLSRWYGLRVTYSGKMPTRKFTGKIYRNLKLSSALKILSYFEVKFIVSDKDIYINS